MPLARRAAWRDDAGSRADDRVWASLQSNLLTRQGQQQALQPTAEPNGAPTSRSRLLAAHTTMQARLRQPPLAGSP